MYKIAVSGKAGSGKDTFCKILSSKLYNLSCRAIAFADPIKEIGRCMFPHVSHQKFFGSSYKRNYVIPGAIDNNGNPLTIRVLLQEIGERGKKYNPKIWINCFDKSLQQAEESGKQIVIASDLRFVDEFNYLKEKNFILIRIIRKNSSDMSHISEIQQDQIKNNEFDLVFENNDTLNDLKNKISVFADLLKSVNYKTAEEFRKILKLKSFI